VRRLRRFKASNRGVSTIIAELMMILIVLMMSVIVFVFYSGVFGALLTGVSIHPEEFTIIAAGAPASGAFNASAVQPTGSAPSVSTSGTVCTSSSPITGTVSGVYVPPGQSCTITATANVMSGVEVNFGASLTVQGATISGGIKDNSSSSITLQSGATVSGGISLYGTGNFYLTGSQISSGSVVLNGVKYASISSTTGAGLSGGINAFSSGSVQVDSNIISGGTFFTNDQVVRLTNNSGNGGIHFTNDPNCLMANNTISGGVSGVCTGGTNGGDLDIANTGAYTVSFVTLYLNSQPWSGVSWQLFSGTTEQCGSAVIPVGPCSLWPIVIPPGQSVHITFTWVSPSPTSQVRMTMWTLENNYLDARTDPNIGLVCSTKSIFPPKEPIGFC
jgi:predicted RecA/RadA family phage recombinase